ncbi:MAG: DUF11 domain-containing protein [Chloroflexi bacterium]|nr:MAG: DUF11 domain-containing protein [Chloroflexota bacterium]
MNSSLKSIFRLPNRLPKLLVGIARAGMATLAILGLPRPLLGGQGGLLQPRRILLRKRVAVALNRQSGDYRKIQQWGRSSLAVAIGLGLVLALTVFMHTSTALAGPLSPAQTSSPRSGSQVLLAEDFSSISEKFTPPSGWKVTTGGEDPAGDWCFGPIRDCTSVEIDSVLPLSAPVAIAANVTLWFPGNDSIFLESPAFDASGATFLVLEYDQFRVSLGGAGDAWVDVYDQGAWHRVDTIPTYYNVGGHRSLQLPLLTPNAQTRIRFGWTGTGTNWLIDNVQVRAFYDPAVDLQVAQTAPRHVATGAPATFVVTVTNAGPAAATSVMLTDTLPANSLYQGSRISQGSCNQALGVLACSVGDMAVGAQITLEVDISAPGQAQVIGNAIQAAATQTDPFPATNSALALLQVQNTPAPRYVATAGVDTGDCSTLLSPCASIPYAITQAADNDTIHLAEGVYTGTIHVDRPLTLAGAGEARTTLSGGKQDRVIFAQTSFMLNGLTIADGMVKGRGGGIYAEDTVTLTDVSLLRNVTSQDGIHSTGGGGGIYVEGDLWAVRGAIQQNGCADSPLDAALCLGGGARVRGNAIFTETRFISNSARGAGGLMGTKVWLYDAVFISNTTAAQSGGGAAVGEAVVYGGEFRDNHSGLCGGALFVGGSTFISGTLFTNNTSKSLGGALYSNEGEQLLTIINAQFVGNRSLESSGGAVHNPRFGPVLIENSTFISNTAWEKGGGVRSVGPITVTGSLFQQNESQSYDEGGGGGLYIRSDAHISATEFISNSTQVHGGGIETSAPLTVENSLFQHNYSGYNGGGLWIENGALTIDNTRFVENTANPESLAFGFGGGVYAKESHVVADRTSFIRNIGQRGSAVSLEAFASGYSARFVNSLFVGAASNTASPLFHMYDYESVDILHDTFVGPTSTDGVAVYLESGAGSVVNTIASTFATGIKRKQGTITEDFNLYHNVGSRVEGGVTEGDHSLNGDPAFVDPSADNYRLGQSSAAIDAGVDAVAHDLDGTARPQGNGSDIGAYESMVTSEYKIHLPWTRK